MKMRHDCKETRGPGSRRGRGVSVMVLVMLAGCSGQGPELSPWSETDTSDLESSTDPSDGETTLVTEPTGMDTTPGPGPSRMTETTTGIEPTTGSVSECGNGQIEQGEECDGSDLDGQTCESLGQAPGSVACTADCRLDLSGCVPPGMVLVPAGEFTRGSEQMLDEQPVCQVTLGAYWIDEREVTLDDYAACMDAGQPRQLRHVVRCPQVLRVGRRRHQAPADRGGVGEGRARDGRARVPVGRPAPRLLSCGDERSQLR